jgi:hypothetical protein
MTNGDLHCVDLNSTQVLAYNRVGLFSKRRDLLLSRQKRAIASRIIEYTKSMAACTDRFFWMAIATKLWQS